ncbi:hypothetical protein FJ930_27605 [Mesorhizobium sp. B2-4-15]|uniref:hypothetical protein n=1 Tax=Mesorhizobium sp. B2-4-15 TaxID=2589934 RepID=UPI0011541EC5|nr:hypothetical protein [Mesorhizobium sp. B2-4-15]TPK61498.1 hypothetical protein FJ930_27605 [Mesorhizobium sp. B2-4-15]
MRAGQGPSLDVVDPFTADFYSAFGLALSAIELDIPFRISIIVNNRSATGAAVGKVIEAVTDLIVQD